MNLFLLKTLCLISHPKRFFREHSLVAFSKLRVIKGNTLTIDHTVIRKSIIYIGGNKNHVDLHHADIFNSNISVVGSSCTLRIHDSVRVYNVNLTIKKSTGGSIVIGEGSHLGGGTLMCAGNNNVIRIGESCMIAEDVEIWNSDTHVITIQGIDKANASPVIIGKHVWLGKGVTVLKGVTIGENAIVGMKSVVTHDLRPSTINAGIPAREIQKDVNWHK